MGELVVRWAVSTWEMLVDSAFLLLLGMGLAGIVQAFLNPSNLRRFVGKGRFTTVFRAALYGVPLPLCSCSVLPVAYQLRQSGLSKAGTVSFLISAPETGVDSIFLTYSLTDPWLTVARPVTAFVTASAAGLAESLAGGGNPTAPEEIVPREQAVSCDCEPAGGPQANPALPARLWRGIKHAFTTLMAELSPYLVLGYLLAGLVGVLLGGSLYALPDFLRSGWGGYIGALVIGLPLYICATSSTPLAAALLAAGFSPGAMLVFMMVGPATNIASLAVVAKILKRWALVRYLLIVVAVSLLAGLLTDRVYVWFGLNTLFRSAGHEGDAGWLHLISAAVLALLICYWTLLAAWQRVRHRSHTKAS